MILSNNIGLIGDFLGTIPVMIELSKKNGGLLYVRDVFPDVKELFNLIPRKYSIIQTVSQIPTHALELSKAFQYSCVNNLHMTQAHFGVMGLEVPKQPIKPELETTWARIHGYDYVIAPFSRSLPEEQKWQREKWQSLVDRMPYDSFAMFGNSKYDDKNFISGDNVTPLFDITFRQMIEVLKSAKALISVVTGISHLAHALDVKNFLFVNQGMWGKNPDAFWMDGYIPSITVDDVIHEIEFGDDQIY